MGPIYEQAKKQAVSGWIGMVPRKMVNSTTLRWLGTISCADTLLMITTLNDTHLLAWKLFGPFKSCVFLLAFGDRGECQPGSYVLLWPESNGSGQILQTTGTESHLQHSLQ